MDTYMVERYLPGISEEELRAAAGRVQAAAARMQAEGVAVRYIGSTFAPEDQYCFCLFAGPSWAVVQEANERAQFPFARIVPAVRILPEDPASRLRRPDRQNVVVADASSAGDADVGEQGHHLQA